MLCRQDLDVNAERFQIPGTFQCGAPGENTNTNISCRQRIKHKKDKYFIIPLIWFMRRNLTLSTLFHSSTRPLLKLPLQPSQPTSYSASELVHSAYASMPVPVTMLKTSIQVVTEIINNLPPYHMCLYFKTERTNYFDIQNLLYPTFYICLMIG